MSEKMPAEAQHDSRIEALVADIKAGAATGLDENVQKELGRLLGLLPYLRRSGDADLIGIAEVAVACLLREEPSLKLAEEVREKLAYRVRPPRNPLAAVIRGGTPPTRVILGLGMLLYLTIPALFYLLPRSLDYDSIVGIKTEYLLMVAFAGAVGSIVSIMVRIQEFSGLDETDPAVLFFTGFFKPVVGAAFALFVFAVLRSGLIPVTVNEEADQYFFMALSFVAGFSERFAKDIVKTTESQVGGTPSDESN